MYCTNCGKEIIDEAVICPSCGCKTKNYKETIDVAVSPSKTSFVQKVLDNVRSEPKKMFIMRLSAAALLLIVSLYSVYSLCKCLGLQPDFFKYFNSVKIYTLFNAVCIPFSSVTALFLFIKQHKTSLILISVFLIANVILYKYFYIGIHSILYIGVLIISVVTVWLVKQNILKNRFSPYVLLLAGIVFFVSGVITRLHSEISLFNYEFVLNLGFWILMINTIVMIVAFLVCHYHIYAHRYEREPA